jgi:hypothetical protein
MPQAKEKFDVVGFIMAYESDSLDDKEVIRGFQHLIDTGLVWQLQGCYGRMAKAMIDAGHCTPPITQGRMNR